MPRHFDPKEFLEKLNRGEFEKSLRDELRKLTHEELEQLERLILERAREGKFPNA
jgi:hypothetical protein